MVVKLPGSVQQAMVQQRQSRRTTPLWEGPGSSGINGGITQGLLQNWLVDKERTRLHVMDGLRPKHEFNRSLGYGNYWHLCEEALARGPDPTNKKILPWKAPLEEYTKKLCKKYPLQQDQVIHWYEVCKVQFPHYVEFWSKHPDVVERKPLVQEHEFNLPYTLPSGRVVQLRGKMDSVDLVGKGKSSRIILKENKAKGDIDPIQMKRQLLNDIQVMFYLSVLKKCKDDGWWSGLLSAGRIGGVCYNVVRRPLSGGKGTIVRHKSTKNKPEETKEAFYQRLGEVISDNPEHFFMRWDVGISEEDIELFRRRTLHPILEMMYDDYEWWSYCWNTGVDPFNYLTRDLCFNHRQRHYLMPFMSWNPLTSDVGTPLDDYLLSGGSMVGLEVSDVMYPELEGGEVS